MHEIWRIFCVNLGPFLLRAFGIAGGWCRPKKALEPEHLVDALTDMAAINCSLSDQGEQELGRLSALAQSGHDITSEGGKHSDHHKWDVV